MPKLLSIILFISVSAILSCGDRNKSKSSSIGLYDVSKNDQHILFSFLTGANSSIYQIDIDGKGLKCLIPSTKDMDYYNPKYSKTSNKILFLGSPKKNPNSTALFIANSDGSSIEQIIKGNEGISEGFFSECEDKIYYCRFNEYGHSSPIGNDQAHDVDIYSVNLKDKKVERVTNLNAYAIFQISEYDCQHILMFMPMEKLGGMILFSKENPDKLIRINPANDPTNNPLTDLTMYYTPLYTKQYNVFAFVAPHALYIMNMQDKKAKIVVDNTEHPQVGNFCLFNTQKRILYTNTGENNFYMVNFDGSGLTSIAIPSPVK